MEYLLLGVSVLLGTGKNMVSKHTGNRFSGLPFLFKTNIITALFALAVFSLGGFSFSILKNPIALLLGVLYGVFTMLSQMLFIKAVEYSAAGVCSLIYSMGFIIPTLFSAALGEPFGTLKIIGLALILLCFLLVGNKSGNTQKLYFAFLAMASSGIIGIIQKLIARAPQKFETNDYLILAFFVMLVGSLLGMLLIGKKDAKIGKEFLVTSTAMGVCVAFANSINLSLAGALPGIVFFTTVNGGTIILSSICSRILFRERLKPLQIAGIALGVTAIILLVL